MELWRNNRQVFEIRNKVDLFPVCLLILPLPSFIDLSGAERIPLLKILKYRLP